MLVGERMSKPVITVTPDLPIHEALNLLKKEHISRLPVVHNGKLVGIVSDKDLLNASPSKATTLSVWELNYLLSKITVKEVMSKDVRTITEDTPIEEAARLMADCEIGGLPVVRGNDVVGIITDNDLFKILLELTGARTSGIRVTVLVPDVPGELAKLTQAISAAGGNFVALGTFMGEGISNQMVMFKVNCLEETQVRELVEPLVEKVIDIRMCSL
jgi:acetoin utilization protein AcuB